MRRLSAQSGAAAPLLLIIMLIGLAFGVYLIQNKTNLFSKAYVSAPVANNIGIDEDSIRTEYIGNPGNIRVKFHAEGTGETNLIVVYVYQGDQQVAVLGSVKPPTWDGEDPFPNLPDGSYTIRYVATKVLADGSEKTGEIVDRAYSTRHASDPFRAN